MVTLQRLVIPVLVLVWTGCARPNAATAPVVENSAAPMVAYTTMKREPLAKEVVLNGEFRAYQLADLHAKISGFLREVRVDVGTFVRPGELIATVEIPEIDSDLAQTAAERRRTEAELSRARAELGKAQASLKLVQVSLQRLLSAAKAEPGIIAQQEIDEAQARKAAAEAQVESAKAAIGVEESRIGVARAGEERSKTMAAYRAVVAPFAGVVVKRYADPGALSQASPIVRVAEISRLRLAVQVPEPVTPLLKVGDGVDVRAVALNRKFSGRVARLTRDVAAASRTMEAEIDVANPAGDLAPGMYAEVTLKTEKREEGWTVPVMAVVNGGGNRTVLVVGPENTIAEKQIRTGIETAASYEVLEGLKPDDRVVVSNRSLLRVGLKVEARPAGDR